MANRLAVFSSAQRLRPHDDATYVVFGVNIAAALVGGYNPAQDDPWLGPWHWQAWADGAGGPGFAVWLAGTGRIPAEVWAHPAPVSGAARDDAIRALTRRRDELFQAAGPAAFVWDPGDPGAPPPAAGHFRQVLTTVGTLAGAMAHGLNLAATVKVKGSLLPGATHQDGGWQIPDGLLLVPVIHLGDGSGKLLPAAAGPGPGPLFEWPYDATGSAPPAAAYTIPVANVPEDEGHRYFRLRTYWVAEPGSAAATDPGDDWTVRLADRVADAWNLPRHLLDAVAPLLPQKPGDPSRVDAADYQALWAAVLAAIRDRAGAGLIDTPDGRGLFRAAAEQAAPRPADPAQAAVRDWQIESLRERFRSFDRQLLLEDWRADLVAAVPALADKLPAAAPVPAGPVGPDQFSPLGRVLTAVQDDATLAGLVARQWDRLAAGSPRLTAAAPAFGPLFTRVRFTSPAAWDPMQRRWDEVGALDLTGRDAWAITLAGVTLRPDAPAWEAGPAYRVDLNGLAVRATFGQAAGGTPTLKVELVLPAGAPVEKTVDLPAGTVTHHLRILFQPGSQGTEVAVQVGPTPAGSGPWADAGSWKPSSPADALRLSAGWVRVEYVPGASTADLGFVAPTVLGAAPAAFDAALRDWDVPGLDPIRSWWERFGAAMKAVVRGLQPRRRLALGQTARLWSVWHFYQPGAVDPRTFLADRVREFLPALATHRFDWPLTGGEAPSGGLYADFTPRPPAPPSPAVQNQVRAHLAAFTAGLLASDQVLPRTTPQLPAVAIPREEPADRLRTPTPHAWNVTVDRPGVFDDAPVGSDDDLTRQVAGVGVLLRQAAKEPAIPAQPFQGQPWRLLNTADVAALTTPTTPALAARRAAIPIRGHYQDEARQTVVTYDGQPLTAASPLAGVAVAKQAVADPAGAAEVHGPFRLGPATRPGSQSTPADPLPTLKFGQFYELASFLVGNNGALPKALAPAHPAALADTVPEALDGAIPRRWRYLRRVGIGQPRVAPALDRPVPRDVLPLARELAPRTTSAARPRERFFYDPAKGAGVLAPGARWEVLLPRVIVTGVAHDDPAEGRWSVRFGLREDAADGATVQTEMTALVARVGDALTVTPTITGLATPARVAAGLGSAGPIDLLWEWTGTAFRLRWRRADREEPWAAPLEWAVPAPAAARLYAVVERQAVATADPVSGAPRFGRSRTAAETPEAVPPLPDDPPLVVLRPEGEAPVTFGLRPPATDFQTWARWYDMDLYTGQGGSAAERRDLWVTYHANLPAGPDAPPKPPDLSFDDPAIAGVIVELVPLIVEPRQAAQVKTLFLPRRAERLPGALLGAVQAAPWSVTIRVAGNPGTDRLTAVNPTAPTGIAITVGEKELWELRVYPAAAESFFEATADRPGAQRFHSRFGDGVAYEYEDPTSHAKTRYRLFTPWRLAVEVATRDVLQLTPREEADLCLDTLTDPAARQAARDRAAAAVGWEAVTAAFDGRSVRVLLNKLLDTDVPKVPTAAEPVPATVKLAGDPWRYRYVAGVRVRRQVWRWCGRPVPALPFEAAAAAPDAFPASPTDPANLMVWDTAGFGDRTGLDLLDDARGVGHETAVAELFTEQLTDDTRALYYRFNAQFTSRYAGLFADPPDLIAARTRFAPPAGPGPEADRQATPWRRLVVPCRRTAAPPRPPVRFVIPLTQPVGDPGPAQAPGLLVVLDEAAFAVGGLAEAVEAEIVRVADPWEATRVVSRPQFGPDPTLRGRGWTRQAFDGSAAADTDPPDAALPVDVEGPLGHTFDTNAAAPLFGSAAFLVQPPDTRGIAADPSLAWYFAKVRFRRVLRPEGMADYPPPGAPNHLAAGAAKHYDLTPPGEADWAVTAADLTIPPGAPTGEVTAALVDQAAGGIARGTARFAWVRGAGPAGQDQVTLAFDAPRAEVTWAADLRAGPVRLDLRFTFQQEEPAGGDPPRPPPRHLTVAFRLHEPADAARAHVWRTLQAAPWPDDTAWPDRVTVTATAADLTVRPVTGVAARVSRFTPPSWVQFLPDATALRPTGPETYRVRWGAFDATQPGDADDRQPWFELLDPATGRPVDPTADPGWALGPRGDWPPPAEGSEARFVRRLLLTEAVRDVRGQPGQERYLGLYGPEGGRLRCLHRSPALAPFEREQLLPRVVVRVVEFQVDGLRAGGADRWGWADLFDPADRSPNDARTADAPARVTRVAPPAVLAAVPPAGAPAAP